MLGAFPVQGESGCHCGREEDKPLEDYEDSLGSLYSVKYYVIK